VPFTTRPPQRDTKKTSSFIAEEFDQLGLGNLVIYNRDGQPDALKYEMVSLYLLEVVKDQVQTTKGQAETIEQLKAENESLKAQLQSQNQSFERRFEVLETRMERYESVVVKY